MKLSQTEVYRLCRLLTAELKIGTIEKYMEIFLTFIFGMLGAAVGSFFNVCVDRLPAGRSIIAPPSHCESCQRRLNLLDLIPIFSYLFLRGRCRYCGVKIPLQILLVELGCGLWTACVFWQKGLSVDFAVIAFFSLIFILIGLLDYKTQVVYNAVIWPAIGIALLVTAFILPQGIVNGLEGAGLGAGIILIPFLITRGRGMGFGDVEIAILIGLLTGFFQVVVPIMLGIILGGIAAIILLALRIKKRKDAIPFGPFLSLATIVSLMWGSDIYRWYMALFSL
jgi:leader peptidase (prepilin peptidase) / N-methyltransferase